MIFSRNRGRHTRTQNRDDVTGAEAQIDAQAEDRPAFGPYDASEAPDDGLQRLDLGALRIPAVPGVEVRLDAAADGQVRQVHFAHGASRLQLGVYAAPRSEGIWDEVRAELRGQLQGRSQETEGEYGPELRGRVKDGSSQADVRHVGIDGPRWFVHAMYVGAAASDPERAGPLREVLRNLVVDRGIEARPVSEPLPLRLPPEAVEQMNETGADDRARNERGGGDQRNTGADDRARNERGGGDRRNTGERGPS